MKTNIVPGQQLLEPAGNVSGMKMKKTALKMLMILSQKQASRRLTV